MAPGASRTGRHRGSVRSVPGRVDDADDRAAAIPEPGHDDEPCDCLASPGDLLEGLEGDLRTVGRVLRASGVLLQMRYGGLNTSGLRMTGVYPAYGSRHARLLSSPLFCPYLMAI